jgi:cobalt-zinc-cadmium efflux system membrane fusion protein
MKALKFILPILVLLIGACKSEQSTKETTEVATSPDKVVLTTDQIKGSNIVEAAPTQDLIGINIHANGTIEVPPQNKSIISLQFGGFVKSLNVLDGMAIKKGQTLLTVEHPDLIQLQQDYLEIKGNIDYLKAEFDRQDKLVGQEASSIKNLQLARSQYNMALAKKNGLNAKLDMAGVEMTQLEKGIIQRSVSVKAPFDGIVTKLAIEVGAYAAPTDKLLEIIDTKHAHAEVIVFEKDLPYLKIGQKVKLSFQDENKTLEASIFLIGKEIAKDRSVKVHCHMNERESNVSPGSFFKAIIQTGEKKRYCLPDDAVLELKGKNVIFRRVATKGKKIVFQAEEVKIIAQENGLTAFIFKNKACSYEDKVVVRGSFELVSSLLVSEEEE